MAGREHVVARRRVRPARGRARALRSARLRAATSFATACWPSSGPAPPTARVVPPRPPELRRRRAPRRPARLRAGHRRRALGQATDLPPARRHHRRRRCATSSCSAGRRSRASTPTRTSPSTARSRCASPASTGAARPTTRVWRITGIVRHEGGSPQLRIRAVEASTGRTAGGWTSTTSSRRSGAASASTSRSRSATASRSWSPTGRRPPLPAHTRRRRRAEQLLACRSFHMTERRA